MSQRARVLWVIGLAILPLVALSGFTIWQQYLRDEFVVSTERTYFAQATAYAAEAFLDGHVAAARAVARHPLVLRGRASEELNNYLRQVATDEPDWQALVVVGPDGRTIANPVQGPPIDIAERGYFKRLQAEGKPVVSPALIGLRTGKPIVIIAVPLQTDGGRGALVVPLPTDNFASSLMAKIGSPLVDLVVIDSEGRGFIHPDAAAAGKLEKLEGAEVAALLAGKTGNAVVGFGGKNSLVAYAPVSKYGWGVMLTEPAVTALAPARRQVLERSAVLVVILAVVGALGWTLAGRLSAAFQTALVARAEAERLSADLKRAVQARDEFLATASHDLRNPLATIQAASELLERSVDPGSSFGARLQGCADHILSATRRMATLLDSFLDVSRLEAGKPLELNKSRVDVAALVRQVVTECQQTTPRHQIRFESGVVAANIDGPRLQRVAGNIIGNAIKYSPEGGEIEVKLEAHDTDLLLTVRDRGIGIPAQDQERVFERFQRGSNVVGHIPGTGLGLAGARQIVQQHGGTIVLKSQLGKGSTFTVRMPVGMEQAKAQAA